MDELTLPWTTACSPNTITLPGAETMKVGAMGLDFLRSILRRGGIFVSVPLVLPSLLLMLPLPLAPLPLMWTCSKSSWRVRELTPFPLSARFVMTAFVRHAASDCSACWGPTSRRTAQTRTRHKERKGEIRMRGSETLFRVAFCDRGDSGSREVVGGVRCRAEVGGKCNSSDRRPSQDNRVENRSWRRSKVQSRKGGGSVGGQRWRAKGGSYYGVENKESERKLGCDMTQLCDGGMAKQ